MSRLVQKLALFEASVILLLFAVSAASQETPLARDPTLAAILSAESNGRLVEAEKLLDAAIRNAEQNSRHNPRLSLLLIHLAGLRLRQGRTADAIATTQRALAFDEKLFGPESARVATDLSNLGLFYAIAGDNATAEQSYKRGLAIARQNPGPRTESLLILINNLSEFYAQHHREADAQALIEEGLRICDREQPGPRPASCAGFRRELATNLRQQGDENAAEGFVSDAVRADPDSGRQWYAKVEDLETLARQYEEDNSYDLAEAAYRQAIDLIEKNSNRNHPTLPLQEFNLLGELLVKEGRNSEAEDLFKRALEMQEQEAGPKRPDLARLPPPAGLLNLYRDEGRLSEMEPIFHRWLALEERVLGPSHIALADTLLELARVYEEEQKYAEAEPLYRRALAIQQSNLGSEDPHLPGTLDGYAAVLQQLGQAESAQALRARAEVLRRKPPAPALP